jgi:hypothetical protein
MTRTVSVTFALGLVLWSTPAWSQTSKPRPTGRVSFYTTAGLRSPKGAESEASGEFATSITFRTADLELKGLEVGVDVRHTGYSASGRPQRVSIYDGFVGMRLGAHGQFRGRVGHLWLPDLGTAGALAGAVIEYRGPQVGTSHQWTAGAFAGAEPLGYQTGYASGVRKFGGYVGFQRGFMQRHIIGFAQIRQGALTERTMLSVTNYIPAGRSFFMYQALEYDIKGPAAGAAKRGLSYFLVNARASAGPRVELQGTYNKGRSINARQLTDDVLNGRPLSTLAIDGLRYETKGGRVSLRVTQRTEVHAGYARDRNNRDDAATGRLTVGGYSSNLLGSGLDVAMSDARIDRPSGPYHSRYISIGRSIGRSWYVASDYSTSLAVVRFVRSDGVVIETRPWTRRLSANVSATLGRRFSLTSVVDYTMDEGLNDIRVMTGVTWRLR